MYLTDMNIFGIERLEHLTTVFTGVGKCVRKMSTFDMIHNVGFQFIGHCAQGAFKPGTRFILLLLYVF